MTHDNGEVLVFNCVCDVDKTSQAWADVVMSLSRRLGRQAEVTPEAAPFTLHLVFHAPGRYVHPDWSGVRLGRLSKRHGVLTAQVALEPSLPADPVAAVLRLAAEAVEAAVHHAKRRKLADDLPGILAALRRLEEAGPAPVRREAPPVKPTWPANEPDGGSLLRVTTSTGEDETDPSEGFLESLLDDLLDGTETWIRLDRVSIDDAGHLRLERVGTAIELYRHDHSKASPLVARARDPEQLAEALVAWAFRREAMPDDLFWQFSDGPTSV